MKVKPNFLIYTPLFNHPKFGKIYYDLLEEEWCDREPYGRGANSYVELIGQDSILVNGIKIKLPESSDEVRKST